MQVQQIIHKAALTQGAHAASDKGPQAENRSKGLPAPIPVVRCVAISWNVARRTTALCARRMAIALRHKGIAATIEG